MVSFIRRYELLGTRTMHADENYSRECRRNVYRTARNSGSWNALDNRPQQRETCMTIPNPPSFPSHVRTRKRMRQCVSRPRVIAAGCVSVCQQRQRLQQKWRADQFNAAPSRHIHTSIFVRAAVSLHPSRRRKRLPPDARIAKV